MQEASSDILAQGAALFRAGDMAGAEAAFRKGLPDPRALYNLGAVCDETGRWDEAERFYRQALEGAPDYPLACYGLGRRLRLKGELDAAEALLRRARALRPDAWPDLDTELAFVLLSRGDYPEGLRLFESRPARRNSKALKLGTPEWSGENLAGKRLFVWREQGLGDQIMLARFLPLLGAKEVIYSGPPALGRLFSQLGVRFIPDDKPFAVPPHEAWTLPYSMIRHFGLRAEMIPNTPYLTGSASRQGGVGVMWRGSGAVAFDQRSLPAELGAELLALPDAVSLVPEDTGAKDFQDTADLIAGLDLVITIDTSVAHLAGAMGKPVWILLHHALEWRWSPRVRWYASARLFPQPAPGDWRSAIDQVRAALAAHT